MKLHIPRMWQKARNWSSLDITGRCTAWQRDPPSHPEIKRMSKRELADLPFDARCICGR